MKRFILTAAGVLVGVGLVPAAAYAAIAYDASSQGTVDSTSLTFSHTVTGTDTILFVEAGQWQTGDAITGVTFNGTAMTLVDKQQVGSINTYVYLYYLIAPATGTHDVVISSSGSADIRGAAASYTGAAQSGVPDATSKSSTTSGGDATGIVTTIADNSWVVMSSFHQDCSTGCTAGADTTIRKGGTGNMGVLSDSNAAVTPAGSRTLIVNGNSGSTGWVAASFAPSVAGGGGEAAAGTSTPYVSSKDEQLFIFGLFLFLVSVPFWNSVFSVTRGNYDS